MLISTERLVLRALRLGDRDRMAELLANAEVTANLAIFSSPPTEHELSAWINSAVVDAAAGEDYRFGIYQSDTDLLIGNIGLHPKWPDGVEADFGYWLGREFWGQGYASEVATRLVADARVLQPSLERLSATTAHENDGSIKLLERLGFTADGEVSRPLAGGGSRVSKRFIKQLQP